MTKRPILREIWISWSEVLQSRQMRLVLSGTGIKLQALEATLLSGACKLHPYQVKHNVGAFEDAETQAEYIKLYIPADWADQCWSWFLIRAWAWFHGRYRNTATLIWLLLEAGYKCPHRTMNEYIFSFTDFYPTDGKDWVDREPQLPSDFNLGARLNKLAFDHTNDAQIETLCDALYDQILYGHYTWDSFTSQEKKTFVEYGFARHRPGTDDPVLDEPLAILAALRWVNEKPGLSLFNYLRRGIHSHRNRQNGFEAYLAFYMRAIFETAPELDGVFTFRNDFAARIGTDLAWQHEKFELVTVAGTADSNNPTVSVVTPSSGSSPGIGFIADSGEDVLDWISVNANRFTVCFPPESFGPDLLCFVRSRVSQKLLLIAIQAKKYENVPKVVLIHGVRSVTPSWFWKRKEKRHPTADSAPFIKKADAGLATLTEQTLAKIPLGLKAQNAEYPVLRVFASWPGEAKLERSSEWNEESKGPEDPDGHPLASLHLENFLEFGKKFDRNWFQGNMEQMLVVHSKSEGSESGSRKRTRLEASISPPL